MAKVTIVAQDAQANGGAGAYTARLARELAGRGHAVSLIATCISDPVKSCGLTECVRIDPFQPRWRLGLWRLAAIEQLQCSRRQLQCIHNEGTDVVIVSSQMLGWAYLRRAKEVTAIYMPHSLVAPVEVNGYSCGSQMQRLVTRWVYHRLEHWLIARTQRTIRFSAGAADAMGEYYGASCRSKLEIIPMPVDLPDRPSNPDRTGPFRLLFVGRLVESKNVKLLLDVLSQSRALEWVCDIVGDGAERDSLQKQAIESGLADRVIFHGFQSDPAAWYSRSHLLAFPSKLENSPLVLREAMSFSVPSLSIRSDGVRYRNMNHELIEHGRDGWLVEEAEFGKTLRSLIAAPGAVRECGERALEKARQMGGWSEHIDRYEQLFKELGVC